VHDREKHALLLFVLGVLIICTILVGEIGRYISRRKEKIF